MYGVSINARKAVAGHRRPLWPSLLGSLAWSCAGALAVGVLAASGSLSIAAASGTTSAPHVMIVMMENQSYSNVIGNSALPFTNGLASDYGLATESYSFFPGSLPNYLEIVSGSNQGVTDESPPSSHNFPGVRTLANQLVSAGYGVAAYAESLPSDPTNNSGLYLVSHNPWEYFPGAPITVNGSSALIPDLNRSSPPDFVWYTPNLTDDGHTGVPTDTEANELKDTDAFLSSFIPSVQATSWYKAGGQIIIEWDEGVFSDYSGINGGSGGGHIPTIVVSNYLASGPHQVSGQVDTVGILHTIEDRYGLSHLGGSSADGTIDALLSIGGEAVRAITSNSHASAVSGHGFLFDVQTSGTPTPNVEKHGKLPRGIHFRKNKNGTATLWGTPKPGKSAGTYSLTFTAQYGKGKTKQIIKQLFTLTLSG